MTSQVPMVGTRQGDRLPREGAGTDHRPVGALSAYPVLVGRITIRCFTGNIGARMGSDRPMYARQQKTCTCHGRVAAIQLSNHARDWQAIERRA